MGRAVKWLFVALVIPTSLFGQFTLSGKVSDVDGHALHSASVIIKDSAQKITVFGYTDKTGNYNIRLNIEGIYKVTYSSLGYKLQTLDIRIGDKKELTQNVALDKVSRELQEVVIRHVKPVIEEGDKVIFSAESFLQGNEEVVEDLLKKIPGLNVSSDGTIKYGDQEVQKVMVEGDDFFARGYKVLTKNMPVSPINKVELLRNYSNNKHLKGIENSHKVALNLTLKDNYKARWFGNIAGGVATQKRFETKGNLMKFRKKAKYYFLGDANNTGIDATGDISHLIRSVKTGEPGSIGDNQGAETALHTNYLLPDLHPRRAKMNHDKLLSLNGIFDITPQTKLKALLFVKNDRLDFVRNNYQTFFTGDTSFANTEYFKGRKLSWQGFGKLELIHDFSEKSTIEYTMKINQGESKVNNLLVFNNIPLKNNLIETNRLFDHKIVYTFKLNERKVWIWSGRHLSEQKPQVLFVDHFLFGNLFKVVGDSSEQRSSDRVEFMGINIDHLIKGVNNGLWEFKLGNEYRNDLFSSTLIINSGLENIFPSEYQNNLSYNTSDTYFTGNYIKKWRNIALGAHGDLHYLKNRLYNDREDISKQFLFFNPKFNFDWKVLEKQKLRSSYSLNTTNAKVLDVFEGYIQTGYRTLNKGWGDFQQLNSSSFTTSYTYGNWSDNFFALLSMIYIKNHDFLSTNSYITESFSLSEKILVHNRSMMIINGQVDRFINPISSNLKLVADYNKINFKNRVNGSELREVVNTSISYGLELRSAFKKHFNYHMGTKWNNYAVMFSSVENTFTNNISFLDLYFAFSPKIDFKLQIESYYFGNLQQGNRQFNFLDLEGKYKLKENKFSLSLICNNLLGTSHFRNLTISDINISRTQYALQPRYLMLKAEIRF